MLVKVVNGIKVKGLSPFLVLPDLNAAFATKFKFGPGAYSKRLGARCRVHPGDSTRGTLTAGHTYTLLLTHYRQFGNVSCWVAIFLALDQQQLL